VVLLKHNLNSEINEEDYKMKKRILMLLMAMMMVLGMSLTSYAEFDNLEGQCFSGTICFEYHEMTTESYGTEVEVNTRYENGGIIINFVTDHGHEVTWSGHNPVIGDGQVGFSQYGLSVNGNVYEINGGSTLDFNSAGEIVGIKFVSQPYGGEANVYISTYLVAIEDSESPVHQVSNGFTGTATSDRGDYSLYIAGYFRKDLTNGTHVLALSDITSQTIAVVAHNNANGVNRNMNQSTIEEMTVTVSGGAVTEMIIRGRVQTDGGTLDRYTATINP